MENKQELDMVNDSNLLSDEQLDLLIEYILQIISGKILTARNYNQSINKSRNNPIENFKLLLLDNVVYYINTCYMNLLKDDDKYVNNLFTALKPISPICIFDVINEIITKILPKENLKIDIVPSLQLSDEAVLNVERKIIKNMFRPKLYRLKEFMQFKLKHYCTNLSIKQLREEWVQKGKPEETIINIGIN